jgi:hypothetical protein
MTEEIRPDMRTTRTALIVVAAACLLASLATAPASAATAGVKLALKGTPSPVVDGQMVTWTGTITPVYGTVGQVRVYMASNWYQYSVGTSFMVAVGTCEPADTCQADSQTGNAYWTLRNISKPVTITYTTQARTGVPVHLYVQDDTPCYGTCPASAKVSPPTPEVSVAWSADAYPVMPGATLHVTLTGTTDAGPVDGDLQARLSGGLGEPTGITPATALYAPPPYHYIDDGVTILAGSPQVLAFDTVVTGAVGSSVTITGSIYTVNAPSAVPVTATIRIGPYTTTYQETNSRLTYRRTWTRLASTGASGGSIKETSARDASVKLAFRGLGLTWYATTGPTRGRARVYIDGVAVKTVNLYRTSKKARVPVYTFSQATPVSHTIRIVNLGTSGHPRVNVDAFVVRN